MPGDPERLQQVVWNLLTNAVKFTPHGRHRCTSGWSTRDGQARVIVSDTGRGIAPDFLPHLFERFRQADSRFSREHGGLGLGLAIAREIVETHGGSIHAASGGEGTRRDLHGDPAGRRGDRRWRRRRAAAADTEAGDDAASRSAAG